MPFISQVSSVVTVPFWLVTSDGTSPDTGASGDSIILYASASGTTFVPDLLVGAVHAAAGQYRAVLSASNTSQLGPLWGYHAQGSFHMPIFALDIRAGSLSTFAASTDSVGLKAVTHSGATVGVGGIAPATYSGVTVGVNNIAAGTYSGVTIAGSSFVTINPGSYSNVSFGANAIAAGDYSGVTVGIDAIAPAAYSGVTVGVGGIAPATYSGVTVGINDSSITLNANVVQISGDATAADRLEALMDASIVAQVNDAAATTTSFVADGFTEATNDHFNGRLITFISGALSGQQTAITDYVGATQTLTVTALTEAPADNDFFVIH